MNRIERSNLYGSERELVVDGNDISTSENLAIDAQDNALYWSVPGVGIKRHSLNGGTTEQVITFQDSRITGLAVYNDYVFVGDAASFAIDIYEKQGQYHSSYVIDADPYHITVLEESKTSASGKYERQKCVRKIVFHPIYKEFQCGTVQIAQ